MTKYSVLIYRHILPVVVAGMSRLQGNLGCCWTSGRGPISHLQVVDVWGRAVLSSMEVSPYPTRRFVLEIRVTWVTAKSEDEAQRSMVSKIFFNIVVSPKIFP